MSAFEHTNNILYRIVLYRIVSYKQRNSMSSPVSTRIGDRLQQTCRLRILTNSTQANSASYPQQEGKYLLKGGNALWLGSKAHVAHSTCG